MKSKDPSPGEPHIHYHEMVNEQDNEWVMIPTIPHNLGKDPLHFSSKAPPTNSCHSGQQNQGQNSYTIQHITHEDNDVPNVNLERLTTLLEEADLKFEDDSPVQCPL